MALWQEALETGQKVHPLTEEILNKHAQGPIIIEDERNNSGNREVSPPLQDHSFSCSFAFCTLKIDMPIQRSHEIYTSWHLSSMFAPVWCCQFSLN